MLWELAHRPREAAQSTVVVVEAASSAEAIAEVRAVIAEGEVLLYVRGVDHPGTPPQEG